MAGGCWKSRWYCIYRGCHPSLIWQWILIHGQKIIIRMAGFGCHAAGAATFYHYPKIILFSGGRYLSLMEHHGDDKAINPWPWHY
jgi:cytochrome d ubiquinol oxidase subunit II